jgi:hypothetical protein
MLTIAFFSILAIGVTHSMAHSMAHSMVGIMPPEKILGWEVRDSNQAKKAHENFTDYEDRLDGRGNVVIK